MTRRPYQIASTIFLLLLLFPPLNASRSATAEATPLILEKEEVVHALRTYRVDILEISSNIKNLLAAGRFHETELQLETLLKDRRLNENGIRVLELVYKNLSLTTISTILDRWCESSPDSHYPFTVRGMHYLEKADALGGATVGVLLSSGDRNTYKRAILTGESDLQKAYSLNGSDPAAAASMVRLCLMKGLPAAEMELWFDRAVRADPAWLSGYRAKLQYLSPYRFGSEQKMLLFAVQCVRSEIKDSSLYTLFPEYLELRLQSIANNIAREQFLLNPDIYAMLRECVERYQEEFPRSTLMASYERLLGSALANPYEAITAFTATLAHNPADIHARKGRTDAYIVSGQFDKAVEDAMALLVAAPDSWFALSRLGHIYFAHENDPDIGKWYYDQAITNAPGSYLKAMLLFARGQHYSQFGMHHQAIRDYSQALTVDPLFEKAYLARAESSHKIGRRDDALNDLIVIKSVLRGHLVHRAKALINRYLKPDSQADEISEVARTASPLPPPPAATPQSPTHKQQAVARTYFSKGLQFFYNGEFRKASLMFHRILSLDQGHPGAFYMLGKILENTEKNAETSAPYFRFSYLLEKSNAHYRLAYAHSLFRQGLFSRALSILNDPAAEKSLTAPEYYLRALCQQKLNRHREAMNDIRASLQLDSTLNWAASFPDRLEIKATAYKKVIAEATGTAEPAAIGHEQGHAEQWLSTDTIKTELQQLADEAEELTRKGRIRDAKLQLFKAVEHYPHSSTPFYLLGRLFVKERDLQKAILYFTQAIERDHQVAEYFTARGQCLFNMGKFESAEKDYSSALQLIPGKPELLYARGITRLKLGRTEDARKDFDRITAGPAE